MVPVVPEPLRLASDTNVTEALKLLFIKESRLCLKITFLLGR